MPNSCQFMAKNVTKYDDDDDDADDDDVWMYTAPIIQLVAAQWRII